MLIWYRALSSWGDDLLMGFGHDYQRLDDASHESILKA